MNKTATKVDLRFDLESCNSIFNGAEMARLRTRLKNTLDADGKVQVICQDHRSQLRNVEEARRKLVELIEKGLARPKKRRPTKPSRNSQKKRVDRKTKHGQLKSLRGKVQH